MPPQVTMRWHWAKMQLLFTFLAALHTAPNGINLWICFANKSIGESNPLKEI